MDPNLRKLEEIKQSLNAKFYEREHEVEGILLAMLARQHLLMIGPAGTAKSALSTELAKIIDGTNYFQWLLTPFSTPEEVFGPLSLKELEVGVYKRNTRNKMPEADLVFLDEIFKANSAILNSLLTLINERLFYNGDAPVETPLISVIGASNEYPEEGEGLEALFDRFLLRYEISYIEDEQNFLSMLKSEGKVEELPSMDLKELYQLQELTDNVHVPDEVFETLVTIRQALFDEGIRPSDRRFKQALCVLKAKAVLHQRNHVQLGDLSVLENALWETLDQKETVCNVIRRHTTHSVERTLATIEREAEEIYDMAVRDPSAEAGMEAMEKLKVLVGDLEQLKEDEPASATKIIELSNKLTSLSKEVENSRVDEQYTDGTVDSTSEQNETEGVFFRM